MEYVNLLVRSEFITTKNGSDSKNAAVENFPSWTDKPTIKKPRVRKQQRLIADLNLDTFEDNAES